MQEFDYQIHYKATIWQAEHYTVKAETQEEADAIMKQEFKESTLQAGDEDGPIEQSETIDLMWDTEDRMNPEDNGGQPTRELLRMDHEGRRHNLADNTPEKPEDAEEAERIRVAELHGLDPHAPEMPKDNHCEKCKQPLYHIGSMGYVVYSKCPNCEQQYKKDTN